MTKQAVKTFATAAGEIFYNYRFFVNLNCNFITFSWIFLVYFLLKTLCWIELELQFSSVHVSGSGTTLHKEAITNSLIHKYTERISRRKFWFTWSHLFLSRFIQRKWNKLSAVRIMLTNPFLFSGTTFRVPGLDPSLWIITLPA